MLPEYRNFIRNERKNALLIINDNIIEGKNHYACLTYYFKIIGLSEEYYPYRPKIDLLNNYDLDYIEKLKNENPGDEELKNTYIIKKYFNTFAFGSLFENVIRIESESVFNYKLNDLKKILENTYTDYEIICDEINNQNYVKNLF